MPPLLTTKERTTKEKGVGGEYSTITTCAVVAVSQLGEKLATQGPFPPNTNHIEISDALS